MTKLLKITFILIIILLASCETKISEVDFEKNVMTEILPNLIDSTCIDRRIMLNFPPKYGELIYDKEGRYVKTDSTKATEKEKLNLIAWKKKTAEIEKDTSKIIIAFEPKIKFNNEDLQDDLEKHFKGSKLQKLKKEDSLEYNLDFEKIILQSRFKLKNLNQFPERDKIWVTKYNFNFSGVAFFRKIQFDKYKKFGILNGGFVCGGKCGQGFRIYIKKINGKWKIDKVEGTWIS
jgi:hypothetical protein